MASARTLPIQSPCHFWPHHVHGPVLTLLFCAQYFNPPTIESLLNRTMHLFKSQAPHGNNTQQDCTQRAQHAKEFTKMCKQKGSQLSRIDIINSQFFQSIQVTSTTTSPSENMRQAAIVMMNTAMHHFKVPSIEHEENEKVLKWCESYMRTCAKEEGNLLATQRPDAESARNTFEVKVKQYAEQRLLSQETFLRLLAKANSAIRELVDAHSASPSCLNLFSKLFTYLSLTKDPQKKMEELSTSCPTELTRWFSN